jgi:hypothetical protein
MALRTHRNVPSCFLRNIVYSFVCCYPSVVPVTRSICCSAVGGWHNMFLSWVFSDARYMQIEKSVLVQVRVVKTHSLFLHSLRDRLIYSFGVFKHSDEVHSLQEPAHVMPYVVNLTEGNSCVCIYEFPTSVYIPDISLKSDLAAF